MFPFSKFEKTEGIIRIIHGKTDKLRPWEYVKVTYEKKIEEEVVLLEDTDHEVNEKVKTEIVSFLKAKL